MKASFWKSGCALLCAAVLLMLGVPAEAAKPIKPPTETPDPCENMNQPGNVFPSHLFTRSLGRNTLTWGIYLADSTGKCERLVGTYEGGVAGRTLELWVSGSSGVILDTRGSFIQAMSLSIDFDAKGIPTVAATNFATVVEASALPPASVAPTDWQMQGVDIPYVSPDGTAIVMDSYGTWDGDYSGTVTWVCNFGLGPTGPSASGCRSILFTPGPEFIPPSAGWGLDAQTVYFTNLSTSGAGNAVFRLTLPEDANAAPTADQIWSKGTSFALARATELDGKELLVVSETNESRCAKIYVVDAGTCSNNACTVLNGAGHDARWGGWLPNGQIVAEGQSPPKRGYCSATNQVVSFDSDDTTGTVTVLSAGYQPNGAGSD